MRKTETLEPDRAIVADWWQFQAMELVALLGDVVGVGDQLCDDALEIVHFHRLFSKQLVLFCQSFVLALQLHFLFVSGLEVKIE